MRISIFGFNQEAIMESGIKVSVKELLVLDYIRKALASPNLEHIVEDGVSYVWLQRDKILDDLPILDISLDALKKMFVHLKEADLLITTTKRIAGGSKGYYAISGIVEEWCLDRVDSLPQNTAEQDSEPEIDKGKKFPLTQGKNSPSDNKLIITEYKSNTKVLEEKMPKKKQNLFSKCIEMINEYTNDTNLKDVLVSYLKMRLEIKDKVLYANQFKGMLNKLETLSNSVQGQIDIVQQSINRGYLGFFPISSAKSSFNPRQDDIGDCMIKTDYDSLSEDIERRKSDGRRISF